MEEEPWGEAYWEIIESTTDAERSDRDVDWGATLSAEDFTPAVVTRIPWTREVTLERWLRYERSVSYIGLSRDRHRIVDRIAALLRDVFGDGPVRVPYRTDLWIARRR